VISTQVFSGASTEDATAWLAYFLRRTRFKRYANDDAVRTFPLVLRGTAADWHEQVAGAFAVILIDFSKSLRNGLLLLILLDGTR